jgi:beta-galactosidase GanA
MKAGGIDIVATYVFWIHHEETEGEWNWSGERDLRRFVETAKDVGLHVIVRCGPWCHGEVRNGGLPDWIVARGKARTDDPAYTRQRHKPTGRSPPSSAASSGKTAAPSSASS